MLNPLLAPAQIFRLRPTFLGDLLFRPEQTAQNNPIKRKLPSVKRPPRSHSENYTYSDNINKSSSLQIFRSITSEQFVNRLLTKGVNKELAIVKESGQQFSVNLSVRYNVSLDSTRQAQSEENRNPTRNVVRKSVVRNYQSNSAGSTQTKSRNQQVKAFYRQTERFASQIQGVRVRDYRGVRNRVAAAFEYELQIDFGFLQQFYSQSKQLSELGELEFGGYLSLTDATLRHSTDLTKSFFNAVDDILDSSLKRFLENVNQFFKDIRTIYTERSEILEQDKNLIVSQVTTFFDRVQTVLDEAEHSALQAIKDADKLEDDTKKPAEPGNAGLAAPVQENQQQVIEPTE